MEATNKIKKDITICTGDFVHKRNTKKEIDGVWPELAKLTAPDGVYSILGNHDHWADFDRSMYWMERTKQDLRHKAITLTRGSNRLWIGGSGDFWEDTQGIDLAFKEAPPQDIKILLAHNPDTIDTHFKTRVDLTFSGHTHGGQVVVPFYGPPILPVENKRYSSGLIDTEKGKLFISRGLGWTILPVRFNCFPEVAIIRLVPKKGLS